MLTKDNRHSTEISWPSATRKGGWAFKTIWVQAQTKCLRGSWFDCGITLIPWSSQGIWPSKPGSISEGSASKEKIDSSIDRDCDGNYVVTLHSLFHNGRSQGMILLFNHWMLFTDEGFLIFLFQKKVFEYDAIILIQRVQASQLVFDIKFTEIARDSYNAEHAMPLMAFRGRIGTLRCCRWSSSNKEANFWDHGMPFQLFILCLGFPVYRLETGWRAAAWTWHIRINRIC